MSKCSMCWDMAAKFALHGDYDSAYRAAKLADRIAKREGKRKQPMDHEARMALGELNDASDNIRDLLDVIKEGDELPGWVSAYITLASDYLNSVAQFMRQDARKR